jgi:hypothetical protein
MIPAIADSEVANSRIQATTLRASCALAAHVQPIATAIDAPRHSQQTLRTPCARALAQLRRAKVAALSARTAPRFVRCWALAVVEGVVRLSTASCVAIRPESSRETTMKSFWFQFGLFQKKKKKKKKNSQIQIEANK